VSIPCVKIQIINFFSKDVLKLISTINEDLISKSAEGELKATQSCVEASSHALKVIENFHSKFNY